MIFSWAESGHSSSEKITVLLYIEGVEIEWGLDRAVYPNVGPELIRTNDNMKAYAVEAYEGGQPMT